MKNKFESFSDVEVDSLKESMSTIITRVNRMGGEDEVAEILNSILISSHRTLQQSFWRVIWILMKKYSEALLSSNFYDLRNEHSVKWCEKISKSCTYFPYV